MANDNLENENNHHAADDENVDTSSEHLSDEQNESEYEEQSFHDINPEDMSKEELDNYALNIAAATVYKDNVRSMQDIKTYRSALTKSIIVNALLTILVCLLLFAFTYYPKTKYIPTKDNTAICEVYPEDNPNLTDSSISEFAKDGILSLYTFDYINYEEQMNNVLSRYFTPQGRAATASAITEAGLGEYAQTNALTFKASAINAVRIEKFASDSNGRAYWIVRFPMVLDIYSGGLSPIDTQKHLVTVRVSADTASVSNPRGLGITSVTLEPIRD